MDSQFPSTTNINGVFESLRGNFKKQDAVRDLLREKREAADTNIRAAQHELITFHTTRDLHATATNIKASLKKTGEALVNIESVLPEPSTFYRYCDLWTPLRQMTSMVAVVIDFVDNNTLADIDRVKEMCGGHDFKLPLEDYLYGVCNAVSEFVRLSMNRVIMMDYQTPARCTVFATHIFEAFRELNFKNDFLRKRYDGIKYDIKKLEEIVYDLSIRGLISTKKQGEKRKRAHGNGDSQISEGHADGAAGVEADEAKAEDDDAKEKEIMLEEPKQEEPKQEEPKQEEPKQEEPKKEKPKQEEPKQEEPKQEEPKQEDEKATMDTA